MRSILLCVLFLTACCNQDDRLLLKNAQLHSEKLRDHFTGYISDDISYLIEETSTYYYQLQARNLKVPANKFASYLDVLMYGNKTLAESVRDVQILINYGTNPKDFQQKCCILNPFKN